MNKRKLASLEITNDKAYFFPVMSFIDAIAGRHTAIDVSRYNQMRLVVGEILKQRIEKSYPGTRGEIFVEIFLAGDFFEISVRDKGVPGWQDFSFDKNLNGTDNNELRNYMISLFVDEIGMEKLGNSGQRIFVRKKILNPLGFVKPEPYEEKPPLDTNITIRPVEDEEDVIEAIRCIYAEYGYSYSYERLYYVNSFMELIKNKEIMSFLAVNDHGQTAGHFLLTFSDMYKNMPEVSTVVIKKEFRGLGLFAKFMDYCDEVGKKCGFRALMGQPVTYHPMSQKAFLKAGYTATSLLMSYINPEIESEYNKNGERLGLSVSVKILDENACSKVYMHKEISGFAEKIYKRLGVEYELQTNGEKSDFSEMSVETNTTLKMTKIVVKSAGDGLESELRQAVMDSIKNKSEMVELAICLNEPSAVYAYDTAKKCDFVISGIIPGAENGDYLIMQMLLGDKMDYDKLVLVGEFEELREDILYMAENVGKGE